MKHAGKTFGDLVIWRFDDLLKKPVAAADSSPSHRHIAPSPNRQIIPGSPRGRVGLNVVALVVVCALCGGCEFAGLVANTVSSGDKPLKVNAEYRGLENRRVAVLVDANPALLFEQPLAQREVCEAVCLKLAGNVPGIQVVDPKQTVDFQQRNLYWNTVPYAELAKRLGVTRLVVIELTDYQLHEPGNVNVWRGVLAGSVAVAEADGPTPNNLTYDTLVNVAYPPNKPLGVLNADQRTIRMGTLDLFAHQAAGRFFNHEESPAVEK